MTMIRLDVQDWDDVNFAYAPPCKPMLVAPDWILFIRTIESRGPSPWSRVSLKDGTSVIARGLCTEIARLVELAK